MKTQTFQSQLDKLETKSYSMPIVNNDNAYFEALFKTLKCIKTFPAKSSLLLKMYGCKVLHLQ